MDEQADNACKSVSLQIRVADDVIASLDLLKIHFVKIDVEGFEKEALKGFRHATAKHRPVIFFELNVQETGREEIELLLPRGYNIKQVRGPLTKWKVFSESPYHLVEINEMEVLRRGNYLALPEGIDAA